MRRRDESPHVIRDNSMKADGLMTHVQDMPATFYKGYGDEQDNQITPNLSLVQMKASLADAGTQTMKV